MGNCCSDNPEKHNYLYRSNKQVACYYKIIDGNIDGWCTLFDQNGNIIQEILYEHGDRKIQIDYDVCIFDFDNKQIRVRFLKRHFENNMQVGDTIVKRM
jgi:hypothetical protein